MTLLTPPGRNLKIRPSLQVEQQELRAFPALNFQRFGVFNGRAVSGFQRLAGHGDLAVNHVQPLGPARAEAMHKLLLSVKPAEKDLSVGTNTHRIAARLA